MEVLTSFRQFITDSQPEITVEEIGPILEHSVLGNYNTGYKKYRVTFQAPKNQRAWKTGDFTQDIVYVVTDSPHTAKHIAQAWIIDRLDPKENDDRPRRVPKDNYLRATERRHLDLKSRVVGSWKQVTEMLGYAAERRQNTVDFVDEPELEILVDALSGRAKQRLIDSLSEYERKGLRQLLKATKQHPEQWTSHGTKAAEFAKALTKILWPRRGDDLAAGSAAAPVPQTSLRNSIYRRKLTLSDARKAVEGIKSYADVVKTANRYGIPMSELDGIVQERYGYKDQEYEEKRRVYADLYKRLHITSKHKALEDDHASPYWGKRGFDWSDYATGTLPSFGLKTIRNVPDFHTSDYTANAEYQDWAVDWLWNLYKDGPPKREGTQTERYKEALEEALYGFSQNKTTPQPAYTPTDEEIPW